MLNQIIHQFGWNSDETVDRIVNNFLLIQDMNPKAQKLLFLMTIERLNKFDTP